MEEQTAKPEETAQREAAQEAEIKFSLKFYIVFAVIAIIFTVVSAVYARVFYFGAAMGFCALFSEFLRLYKKSGKKFLLVTAVFASLAAGLLIALWVMRLVGLR